MRFEALRERLLRAGIAPRHVRRYLRELDDHLADLTEAQAAAGHDPKDAALRARALLGEDDELASAMLAQPGLKSWMARWPWLVFGLAPPVTMLLAFFAAGLPLFLIARLHDMVGDHGRIAAPEWFQILAHVTALFSNLVLGPAFAGLLVLAAWRQRLNWKWPLLASGIIAIVGVHMVVHFAPPGQRGGGIGIGVLMWLSHAFGPDLMTEAPIFLAQFLLTLAPALWFMRHRQFARPMEPG